MTFLYALEPEQQKAYELFCQWARELASVAAAWHVEAWGPLRDVDDSFTSSYSRRRRTKIHCRQPPGLETNVEILAIGAGQRTLYFLPDQLFVYAGRSIEAIKYSELRLEARSSQVLESGELPNDAKVVDRRWEFTDRDGDPDRHQRRNRRLPVCEYDELQIRSSSGLQEILQVSKPGVVSRFAKAVYHLGTSFGEVQADQPLEP